MSTADQLQECPRVRQIRGEGWRRWFSSATMDLILWHNELGQAYGFQLCYDLGPDERAITWQVERGFLHSRVDAGRHTTPILRPDGAFDRDKVLGDFAAAAASLPAAVEGFVCGVLRAWPADPQVAVSRPKPPPPHPFLRRPRWRDF